jgi:hypothetical protein
MYIPDSSLDRALLYQGDLIKDFPFLILKKETFSGKFDSHEEVRLEVPAKLNTIMVLSQTCDVQNRENVLVCPVYEIQGFGFNKDEVESIKKRRTGYWFYLPKLEGILEDSVADFQTVYYVPKDFLNSCKLSKFVTLSDWGRHHLCWALSNYFGRPIENKD